MQSGLYVAMAGQKVLQTQLQVVANNIANLNTTGFRAETVSFCQSSVPVTRLVGSSLNHFEPRCQARCAYA